MRARDGDRDTPKWRAGEVAARVGISPSTLRTWNHRYGVGPAGTRSGEHRLYSEADVAELRLILTITDSGIPARAAVTLARTRRAAAAEDLDEQTRAPVRTSAGIEAAARRLDTATLVRGLESALRGKGAVWTWERLCRPALARIGCCAPEDHEEMNAESVLSYAIQVALHRVAVTPRGDAAVLLACTDKERHSLGIETLYVALGEQGIATKLLGPSVTDGALLAAVARVRPRVLVLSAYRPATARTALVRRLSGTVPEVIATGPGWAERSLPDGVQAIDDMAAAVRAVTERAVAVV